MKTTANGVDGSYETARVNERVGIPRTRYRDFFQQLVTVPGSFFGRLGQKPSMKNRDFFRRLVTLWSLELLTGLTCM